MAKEPKATTTKLATDALAAPRDDAERFIDTSTIASVTSGDPSLQSYLDQKYDYTASMSINQQQDLNRSRRLEGAIPVLPNSTLFPSADNNINKGSYSGSVVGNVPIFVGSQLTPFGVFDARRGALKQAADKRVAAESEFYNVFKAPETSRFSVQGQLNDEFDAGLNKWVANAKQQYGDDWSTALKQDPNFNSWVQTMRTVARYETGIVDQVAEVQKQLKDPNFVASPELVQTMSNVMSGVGGLENPFNPEGHKLGDNMLRLSAVYDVDKATNTAIDELIQDVTTSNPGINSQGIYDVLTTTKVTGTSKTKLDVLAENIYKTRYAGSNFITIDDVKKSLYAKVGMKVEKNVQQQDNQFSDSGGAMDVYTENDIEGETSVNASVAQTQGQPARVANVTTTAGVTFKKPIKTVTAKGESMMNMATGLPVVTEGSEEIVWGEARVLPVTNQQSTVPGVVVTDDQMAARKRDAPGTITYQTMAVGKYKKPTLDANTGAVLGYETITVVKPAAELKNAFVSQYNADGSVKRGVPLDKLDAKAQQMNGQGAAPAPVVTSEADYNALPSGAQYMYNGQVYTKE